MIKKVFKQMLLTQIVSSMTVTLCMLIDSIMIGRFLGVDSMSAYGFATPLLLVFAALGSMISAGVQVLCGKAAGCGDRNAADACYTVSVFLAGVISAAGLVLVFAALGPLTTLLGAGRPGPGNAVYKLTRDYITGFIIGAPAFLCAQIMVPYMQISGSRMRLVVAVIAMTVSDIVFDLLNVFVFHGGTFGMGLASTLSYYIAVFIGLGYFLRPGCMFRLRRKLIRRSTCRELISCGVPTVINQVSLVLLVFLLNRLLRSAAGNVAVAAYSVISTVGNICYCFGAGVGSVAMMLSAIFYTDDDRTSIRELVRVMTKNTVVLNAAVTLVVLLAATPLVALFLGDSPEAKRLAVVGLRLFVLSMVPSGLNTAFKSYYQGVNRLHLTELISVLQNFAMPALFAAVLSSFWGATGVWLCYVCGETAALLILSGIVWRKNGRVSLSAEAYELLDPSFGAAPEDCLERKIQSVQDAAEVSEAAVRFCSEHELEPRLARLIGLCIEEMAVNVVLHGFGRDKKPHNVDVRLVIKENSRVIRIRDNCFNFDPVSYLKLHETDDPTAHVGIRMVMKMVKQANYVNTLGLNNLTLVL